MSGAISVSGIGKRYGALQALAGIDLEIARGEFFALLGPNGAGKTTLISILAGLVRADAGSARILGHDVVADYRRARRLLGVVPQELVFDPFFTVRETLAFQSGYFGIRDNAPWIDEVMHHLDLTPKADVNMRALSGGMKRRVLVAQALVHRPPVIVLDEPTAGVDVELRQGLWRFMQRLNADGHTIVLTTHYLEEAQSLCQRVAMLKAGRIVALDTTARLLARFQELRLRLQLGAAPAPAAVLERARTVDGGIELTLARYDEVEPILAQIRAAGCRIEGMDLAKPDLEDVFVRIMHERAEPAR